MRVALIELGGSHEECLYTQLKALRTLDSCEVTLITTPALLERYSLYKEFDKVHSVELGKGINRWLSLWKLNSFLRKQQFDRLVFNTAQGGVIKRVCLLPNFPKTPTFGLLHDLRKLESSSGQKIISKRVKHYFVLADYLKIQAPKEWQQKLTAFYPISFPEIPQGLVFKTEGFIDTCKLVVPGQVSDARRDYFALLRMLAKTDLSGVQVYFLGRAAHSHGDGPALRAEVERLGLKDYITLWDDFIDGATYEILLSIADYVLPLIHPGHRSTELYEHQITGAFNQAYGHRKTMLMHAGWKKDSDFSDTAIFYTEESFPSLIQELKDSRTQAPYANDKWNEAEQFKIFLGVLGLENEQPERKR